MEKKAEVVLVALETVGTVIAIAVPALRKILVAIDHARQAAGPPCGT